MSITKRYNPNRFFFPERLSKRLESIFIYSITIVEAPTGFGKTTAIRNTLIHAKKPFLWINIDNENRQKFYDEFCDLYQNVDNETTNKLKSIGYPTDQKMSDKIIRILEEADIAEKYTIIFDNYHYVANEFFSDIILKLSMNNTLGFHFILITQSIRTNLILNLVFNKKINYIGKTDFEFNKEEISSYFSLCGIKLEDDEIEYLYKYTEGWISAVYLQLLHYISEHSFEQDSNIEKLVCKAIWDKLTNEEQEFLITMTVFESFSLRQAQFVGEGLLTSAEIKELLDSNSFIRYDTKDRKYYIHTILKYFLMSELEKLDKISINRIYDISAKWYEKNEDYFEALKFYYKNNNYKAIYQLNMSLNELLPQITSENREMLINIILKTPISVKEDNLNTSLVFCFILFMYNEKDFFNIECDSVYQMINNSSTLREREKQILIGELKFVNSYGKYNDIKAMTDMYHEAYEYIQSPSSIFSPLLSITFKNPSVLFCFHKEVNKLDTEVVDLEKMMITYYKLTSGNSKGYEALMRAEVLFNRCNFMDAEVLCQKALYMSETRNQISVYISTMFLMARLAIFNGEYEEIGNVLKSIHTKVNETEKFEENFMIDLCEAFIYMSIGKIESIPGWLKSDNLIEQKSNVLTLSFCNLIYGKYLLCNEEYTKLLGISGQMLGTARVYNNLICEIYIYIYISIANYYSGNNLKAIKFICEAINLSMDDKLYIPFIENYKLLSDIFKLDLIPKENKAFITTVSSIYRKFEKNFNSIINTYKNDVDYGLTKRETEVAKLAAQRYTNKEIAEKLFIAESTVKCNLKVIFGKLQIKSRVELKRFF